MTRVKHQNELLLAAVNIPSGEDAAAAIHSMGAAGAKAPVVMIAIALAGVCLLITGGSLFVLYTQNVASDGRYDAIVSVVRGVIDEQREEIEALTAAYVADRPKPEMMEDRAKNRELFMMMMGQLTEHNKQLEDKLVQVVVGLEKLAAAQDGQKDVLIKILTNEESTSLPR